MKETEKVMKQVDKEERRRSKLQSSKPGVTSTPMVVRYNASPAAVLLETERRHPAQPQLGGAFSPQTHTAVCPQPYLQAVKFRDTTGVSLSPSLVLCSAIDIMRLPKHNSS